MVCDHGLVCLHSIIPARWRQTQRSAEEIEKLICLVHENEILYQHQIFVCFKRHSEIILKFIFVFPQRRYELVKLSPRRFNNMYLVRWLFHLLFLLKYSHINKFPHRSSHYYYFNRGKNWNCFLVVVVVVVAAIAVVVVVVDNTILSSVKGLSTLFYGTFHLDFRSTQCNSSLRL